MFPTVQHPQAGEMRVTGTPVKFAATPGRVEAPAPMPGQHTREALRDLLGMDDATLDALAAQGILFQS
jgi:crotonobetainyl-CoA:carnitine CoA-transferase CaiB-like acyl-CoA transferase